ncbi:MAG: hypothetical protein WBZ36_26000 [Candidatus Nitrosopolaris sp.]
MTGYSASDETEKGLQDTGGGVRAVIMPLSFEPRTATLVREASWGQTLEDFYRIHNLDEKRRKYLEDLRAQVNNLSTGGPLNNLLYVLGLD